MKLEPQKSLYAAGLSALLATAAAPASAQDNAVHGWDDPTLAEFTMNDINTRFTTGEPDVTRDVHIDCDLLVKDGDQRHYTTGFAIQFNAETQRTNELLGPQVIGLLQSWRGQMDYRAGKVRGTIVHLEGAHNIPRSTVKEARQRCIDEYPEHGFDIDTIGDRLEGIHPDYFKG